MIPTPPLPVVGFLRAEAGRALEAMELEVPSAKMFHYWEEVGLIAPHRVTKKLAIYRFEDVARLALQAYFAALGFMPWEVRRIIAWIADGRWRSIGFDFLIEDGMEGGLIEIDSPDRYEQLTSHLRTRRRCMFGSIELEDFMGRVYTAAEQVVGVERLPWDELRAFGFTRREHDAP